MSKMQQGTSDGERKMNIAQIMQLIVQQFIEMSQRLKSVRKRASIYRMLKTALNGKTQNSMNTAVQGKFSRNP